MDGHPSKAWLVEKDDGCGAIVWAETRGKARYIGAMQLDIGYSEVSSCRRYRALDGGVPDGLTLTQWQLRNGWHWECQQCSKICYGPEDGGEGTVLDEDEKVFCSQRCLDKYTAYWAYHRGIDDAVREDFALMYPGVELTGVGHNDWLGFACPKGEPMVTVFEFSGPHENHYERRRILRDLQEKMSQ